MLKNIALQKFRCRRMLPTLVSAALMLSSLALLIVYLLPALPVTADAGLQVSGASLVTDVAPGEVLKHCVTVRTGSACDIVVRAGGIAQSTDGGYTMPDAGMDSSPYSARDFITVDKEILHLEPGASGEITITVKVPEDAGTGGRYAMLNLITRPDSSSSVGVATAVNIPIFLTLKNSRLDHTGTITGISTGEIASGRPVEIGTVFRNTGNHHFKIRGEVTVADSQGSLLDTLYTELTPNSIIPGMSRRLTAVFVPAANLSAGTYLVKSKVMLADGRVLDEMESTFAAAVAYVPPPPPVEQTLLPDAASSLITADGRINIVFPAGAVTETATVKLNNYLPEQLPPLPEGYTATNTCFRVAGLSGLLAQEATIRVKYGDGDLADAGGNPSRLKLARWDEGERGWTILKTAADNTNMVLTTKTDRFSIWAVVIVPRSNPDITAILGVALGVIILSLGIFLSLKKKKR